MVYTKWCNLNTITFDIETVPEYVNTQQYFEMKSMFDKRTINKNDSYKLKYGALNPYEGKVILITYQLNENPKEQLQEWNNSEKDGLEHNAIAMAYGFPTKDTKGDMNSHHYYSEDYDGIIKYTEKEFIYPQVLDKIRKEGLVDKARFQAVIKEIISKRETED